MSTALRTHERVNINDLSTQEKQKLARRTYEHTSYFQELFHSDMLEFDCPENSTNLRAQISRLLLEKKLISAPVQLENLHTILSDEMKAYNFNDGVNKISTYFYDTDTEFQQVYHQFIKHIRTNFILEPFWFQATPTIRIHCPNGLNNHHYPRFHSDIVYGHPPEEINLWLPLTEFSTTHGFSIMSVNESTILLDGFDFDYEKFVDSAINDKDFSNMCSAISTPVSTPLGQCFAFDSRCLHTGEPLTTHTRISMDIRILPLSEYAKMDVQYQGSGRRKILFAPGHCYHELDSDTFLTSQGI